MSIDLKFVELTADVLEIFFIKCFDVVVVVVVSMGVFTCSVRLFVVFRLFDAPSELVVVLAVAREGPIGADVLTLLVKLKLGCHCCYCC